MIQGNKVVVITGGASGIGKATSLLFAKNSYDVVIGDLNKNLGEETVREIKESGGIATFVVVDVTKESEVENLISTAVSTYGRLDALVTSAGIGSPPVPLHLQSGDVFDKVIAVNVKGTFFAMKHAIGQLLKQGGGGAIVTISSLAGVKVTGNLSPYSASKHAVVGLARSAARDYFKDKIRVNVVCPGFIDTPLVQKLLSDVKEIAGLPKQPEVTDFTKRPGTVEEVAEAILWLASPASSYVNGTTLVMDGADSNGAS